MEFNTSSQVITHIEFIFVFSSRFLKFKETKQQTNVNGYFVLFAVQAEVIPAILESTQQGLLIGRGGYKPRDICVSAPTGSGKTLSFVIPVIQVSFLLTL